MRDFSLQAYGALLAGILETGREILPVREFFERGARSTAFVVLRHDVDRRPARALRMAKLEQNHAVRSTYYFRHTPQVFRPGIIRAIASMGHEIGYHYEALDKARGEPRRAEEIFARELAEMRALVEVKTAAMHGNPFSRWDNRDLWRHCALSRFDLLGEAYVSVTDPDMGYVTDTGRGWNRFSLNMRDRLATGSGRFMPSFSGTPELIRALKQPDCGKVYLQIHPNRWSSGLAEWVAQWGEDLLLNGLKKLLMLSGIRRSVR